jgi:hypothetical protein
VNLRLFDHFFEMSASTATSSPIRNVAFCGQMCSGKSTLAKHVQLSNPTRTEIESFAKPLKECVAILFPWLKTKEEKRHAFQVIGDAARKIDPDVFVKLLLNRTDEINASGASAVVDDARFDNEMETLANSGWIVTGILVDKDVRNKRIKELYPATTDDQKQHSSEKDPIPFLYNLREATKKSNIIFAHNNTRKDEAKCVSDVLLLMHPTVDSTLIG